MLDCGTDIQDGEHYIHLENARRWTIRQKIVSSDGHRVSFGQHNIPYRIPNYPACESVMLTSRIGISAKIDVLSISLYDKTTGIQNALPIVIAKPNIPAVK